MFPLELGQDVPPTYDSIMATSSTQGNLTITTMRGRTNARSGMRGRVSLALRRTITSVPSRANATVNENALEISDDDEVC